MEDGRQAIFVTGREETCPMTPNTLNAIETISIETESIETESRETKAIGTPPTEDSALGLKLYRQMLLLRIFEARAGELCRKGEMPSFLHLYVGEEAVA